MPSDARLALLEREKQLTRMRDELARGAPPSPGKRSRAEYGFDTGTARARSPSCSTAAHS